LSGGALLAMPRLAITGAAVRAARLNGLVPLKSCVPISIPRMTQVLRESPNVAGMARDCVMMVLIEGTDGSIAHHASIIFEPCVVSWGAEFNGVVVNVSISMDTGESLANGCGKGNELGKRNHGYLRFLMRVVRKMWVL
jgi:hypothetical protein